MSVRTKRLALALGAAAAFLVAGTVGAEARPWHNDGYYYGHGGPRYYGPPPVRYYAPPPVYYAPRPVYVAPPPAYYYPPPAYYAPPGVSFGVTIPIR